MIYIRGFALDQKEKYSTTARGMWGLLHQPWEHSGLWHLCSEKCWCTTQYICTLSISLDGSFFKGIYSLDLSQYHLGLSTGPHANNETNVKKKMYGKIAFWSISTDIFGLITVQYVGTEGQGQRPNHE